MTRTIAWCLLWTPRLLGLLVAVFLGLFALDAFHPDRSLLESVPAFAIHLVPALAVALVVMLSWHREWIGAITCLGLALAYAVMARQRLDWILVIAGPLFLLSVGFFVSWWQHAAVRAALQ